MRPRSRIAVWSVIVPLMTLLLGFALRGAVTPIAPQPAVTPVVVTQIVERQVPVIQIVEKQVPVTQIVEKQVTQIVERQSTAVVTVLVQQQVVVTATPEATLTVAPAVVTSAATPGNVTPGAATATAPTGMINMTGRAATDILGTRISLGTTVSSVIDGQTRPREVYAVALVAGQTTRFTVTSDQWKALVVANPGSKSFESRQVSQAQATDGGGKITVDLTPAVSGTYYVSIWTNQTGVPYTFSTSTS